MPVRRALAVTICILAVATGASAQSSRPSVLLKGGINIERSEDGVEGQSPAFGVDLLLPLDERWTFDVEFWVPRYFTFLGEENRHRDILLSIGVLRHFGGGRTRAFLSFGLGVATTQEKRPFFGDTSNTGGYGYLGGGAEMTINKRFSVIPEVRSTLAVSALIVRPSIGIACRF
jgi:hypothetical protein